MQGPNTVCRSNIERLQDGRRRVTYTPVEVGEFTITITWNGRQIPGTPTANYVYTLYILPLTTQGLGKNYPPTFVASSDY